MQDFNVAQTKTQENEGTCHVVHLSFENGNP